VSREDKSNVVLLLAILLLGAWFRFQGLDWDQGHHLQPDERYISMVLAQLSPPTSLGEYLDPSRSSLSPYLNNFGSYIYGQLPLTIITYLSTWFGVNSFGQTYLFGRFLSAFLDTSSIFLVYFLGKKLWNQKVGLVGATFYALTPLVIQYAHFMVMESWLVFSWLATILLTLWWTNKSWQLRRSAIVSLSLGASLAIKLSSIFLAGFVIAIAGITAISLWQRPKLSRRKRLSSLAGSVLVLPLALLVFRFFQPTIFSSPSWFNWSLTPSFQQAFEFQRQAIAGEAMFPPQWQWVDTPRWWFPLKNLALWGVGPATMILALAGAVFVGYQSLRQRDWVKGLLIAWLVSVFVWQGGRFIKTMRYFIPFIPFYALLAASAIDLTKRLILGRIILVVAVFVSGLWSLMFSSIYRTEQTRLQATNWIYGHIPAGSSIAIEEWDDPLPLHLPGKSPAQFTVFQMAVYAPDDHQKQKLLDQWLGQADWIVLSSHRAKKSIGQLPNKFPYTSRFYQDLESGRLGFVKAVELTSYPSLDLGFWKWELNDSTAEELFWVYDHPVVEIYQKKS
jgi:uncharacterized membrane protein